MDAFRRVCRRRFWVSLSFDGELITQLIISDVSQMSSSLHSPTHSMKILKLWIRFDMLSRRTKRSAKVDCRFLDLTENYDFLTVKTARIKAS